MWKTRNSQPDLADCHNPCASDNVKKQNIGQTQGKYCKST